MDHNDRQVASFTMLAHPIFHAYELVIPVFVVIWIDAFSTTPAVLGVVVGASYALIGLGALPSGMLADHISSKRLVILCMLGMGGSFVLVSSASTLPVLAIALLVWGAAASIYHPASLALISRSAKERGAVFAYHGAAGNVGVAVGPLLATVLLAFFGWRTVALILVAPAALAVLFALRLEFDETAGSAVRGSEIDGDGGIQSVAEFVSGTRLLFTGGFVVVFVIGILYGIYYRGAFTFLPDILADLPLFDPVWLAGREFEPSQYVYSGLLLLGGIGQYAGGKLVDRVRVEHAIVSNYVVLMVIGVTFIPAANAGLVPLLIVAGLLGFFVFMIAPINQEAISKYSNPDVRGLSFGYTYTAIFGVGAVGSTIAGGILTRSSSTVLFFFLAGVVGFATLLGLYLLRSE